MFGLTCLICHAVNITVLSTELPQALREAIGQKLYSHWAAQSAREGKANLHTDRQGPLDCTQLVQQSVGCQPAQQLHVTSLH